MNCKYLIKSPLASIALAAFVSGALQAAPTPDPMGFAAAPAPSSETEIAMVAATAAGTGTIEYYFTETSGNPGATDSGWQTEASYTDTGLDPNTTYSYNVKAREGDLSETAASPDESATTDVALIYEGFNYDAGPVSSGNGGNGFAGAWTQTKGPAAEAIAPGLTFGDLTTVGNSAKSAATLWGHMTRPVGTTLADAGLMDDGATLWFSAIFDNSYPANSGVKNGLALGTGTFSSSGATQESMADGQQGIGILQSNFSRVLAAHWSPNATTDDTGVDISGGPVLFVGKIVWGATGGDAEMLTVYTPDTSLSKGDAKATLTVPALDQSTFDTLAVLTKDHGMIDEIRFGASYEEVVNLPPASNDFAAWIGGFTLADASFNGDDDHDYLPNGIEGLLGTPPDVANAGLSQLSQSGAVTTFTHPVADPALSDLTGSYEWSTDLKTWHASGTVGDTTVTIAAGAPVGGTVSVTADTTGSTVVPEVLLLRVVATQN